jgi:hypothetical protein
MGDGLLSKEGGSCESGDELHTGGWLGCLEGEK